MSATCVQWYVLRENTGLSKHGNPMFLHFCPLKQNLAHVSTVGGGGLPHLQLPNLLTPLNLLMLVVSHLSPKVQYQASAIGQGHYDWL